MNKKLAQKTSIYLGIIQLIVGIGALPAGLSMIVDPSGNGVEMTTDVLRNTPFNNYLIPGVFLFTINGVFNLLCSILSFKKYKYSGILGVVLGGFLVLWIIVQIYFIGFIHFLQLLFFIIGAVEILLGIINTKK